MREGLPPPGPRSCPSQARFPKAEGFSTWFALYGVRMGAAQFGVFPCDPLGFPEGRFR